jgi:hypothetical protein
MATAPMVRSSKPRSAAERSRSRSSGPRQDQYVDKSNDDSEMSEEDKAREQRYAVLCQTVDNDIREAITARENSGIEQVWADDDDQYNGVDEYSNPATNVKTRDQIPRAAKTDSRSRVFVPITKPKTDIGVARVSEMLLPNDGARPWDVDATTIPDIDDALNGSDDAQVQLGDGTVASAKAVAMMIKDKAAEYAKREGDWIEDKFQEGHVYSEMRQVLRDAGRIGTGVIKGPFPVERKTGKWRTFRKPGAALPSPAVMAQQGAMPNSMAAQAGVPPPPEVATDAGPEGKPLATVASGKPLAAPQQTPVAAAITAVFERTTKIEPTSICVRVQDCYPDPSCGDNIHDGAFFVERAWWTGKKLKGLARLEGYDPLEIVTALKEGPMSYAKRMDNRARPPVGDTFSESKLFEVFFYYGDASPDDLSLLMKNGNTDKKAAPDEGYGDEADAPPDPLADILSEEERRYLATVPVVVTMVNGRCIKATLNPMECGGFPYDFFPWEPVKGQPYGRGIPRKMAIAQRIVNAGVRALLENAGVSAGPQIVTTKGAIFPWEGQHEVRGRKGWHFVPGDAQDPDIRKNFMVVDVQSTQPELSAIIQMGMDFADMLTNLPILMQGDQQPDSSPETLGGLKMFFNNAMSPLRVLAKLFDDRLISPHLGRWHDWGMEKGPDNIKGGDSQIVAKGSTAMIQREEGREFLAQVFPVKDDPKLRIDPIKLIIAMASANGFDMRSVQYSDEEWKQIQAEAAKNPPPMDPAVQAAKIRSDALVQAAQTNAQAAQALQQAKAKEAALDRAHEEMMSQVDREIASMQEQGHRSDALVAMKARLAEQAMGNRLKSDEMNLKLDPANATHQGI